MAGIAVTLGTFEFLVQLVRDDWDLSVVRYEVPGRRIRVVMSDDLEVVDAVQPGAWRFGVMCKRGGSRMFVGCRTEAAARSLLERVLDEAHQ